MEFKFTGRNITISEKLSDYIKTKLSKLENYYSHISVVDVIIKIESKSEKVVEVKYRADRHEFFAADRADNVYGAVDLAAEALEKQARRYNDKSRDHHKQRFQDIPELNSDEFPGIARIVESFPKPMTEIEAIIQMRLNEFSFLMFNNADAETLSVLFKRDDKKYSIFYKNKENIKIFTIPEGDINKLSGNDISDQVEKGFTLNSLQPDDAIKNMNDYKSSFYIFSNEDSNNVNIVYHSNENRIGLVKPGW